METEKEAVFPSASTVQRLLKVFAGFAAVSCAKLEISGEGVIEVAVSVLGLLGSWAFDWSPLAGSSGGERGLWRYSGGMERTEGWPRRLLTMR